MGILRTAVMAASALALTLPALAPAAAANGPNKAAAAYGKPTGGARMSVNTPKRSANYRRPAGNGPNTANRMAPGRTGVARTMSSPAIPWWRAARRPATAIAAMAATSIGPTGTTTTMMSWSSSARLRP